MINSYTLQSGTPVPIEEHEAVLLYAEACEEAVIWIDLVAPTPEECERVGRRFSIPPEHMHAALDFNERPRIEYADNILLIVARMPYTRHNASHRLTCPVAAICTPEVVITICLKKDLSRKLLSHKLLGTGNCFTERLALTLLLRISTAFIEELHHMNEQVDRMESALKESMQNQELIRMLHMEKTLIYFLTALKGNQTILEKFHSGTLRAISPECEALLDDAVIENKQAIDMAEIFTQIIGTISDAFGAIVSNNLNKVMKVLTGLTIVFMVPSIIGALYGMNVALPLAEHPHAFTLLCLLCFGASFSLFLLLRKLNWM